LIGVIGGDTSSLGGSNPFAGGSGAGGDSASGGSNPFAGGSGITSQSADADTTSGFGSTLGGGSGAGGDSASGGSNAFGGGNLPGNLPFGSTPPSSESGSNLPETGNGLACTL
jgi:hypothetical protein